MADTYVVIAKSGLRVRSGASASYGKIGLRAYNTEVKVYSKSNGWGKISSTKAQWCSMEYLRLVVKKEAASKTAEESAVETVFENLDTAKGSNTYTTKTESKIFVGVNDGTPSIYNALMQKYVRALGSPPRYTKEVDPYYNNDVGKYTGRAMASTWFSNPSLFSICPGTVDYLPGFTAKDKDAFWLKAKGLASGDPSLLNLLNANSDDKTNGKLYEFKSAYNDYINVVNVMCRTSALYLGIGEEKMPQSNVKYKNFDYSYYSTPSAGNRKGVSPKESIFTQIKKAANTAVTDDAYIHFFLAHQGSAVSENISTSTTQSELENIFNTSALNSTAKNLEYLFGGAIGSTTSAGVDSDVSQVIASLGSGEMVKSFGQLTKNYLKGGRLVFPQMIDTVGYDKSVSATLKFVSPYGDKRSIFLRTIVPVIHLMALSLPKQVAENMYTYPFLCRVYQKGWFNSDLSVISNLKLTRGGSEELSWTVDGLPTEIEASFDITPLYSNMMVSSATHPFLYLKNTPMMEYLSVMCGVDMKANNLDAKIAMATMAIKNKFTGIPANIARGVVDKKLINKASNFLKFTN